MWTTLGKVYFTGKCPKSYGDWSITVDLLYKTSLDTPGNSQGHTFQHGCEK